MRTLQKNPRTLQPINFIDTRAKTREEIDSLETDRLSKVETPKTDPLEFFCQILGVEPTDYEKELIEPFQKNQFVAARWSRQSGKSFTTSGILLNYALVNPNCCIGVVGPSWRQTKLVIRRIGDFARLVVKGSCIPLTNNLIERLMSEVAKRIKHRWMHWSTKGLENLLNILLARYCNRCFYNEKKERYLSPNITQIQIG